MNTDDKNYNKRELDMKFENLEKKMEYNHVKVMEKIILSDKKNTDQQKEIFNILEKINIQTTATNGRVNKLYGWKTGLVMCSGLIVLIIIPLMVYIFLQQSARIDRIYTKIQILQTK